MFNKWLFFMDSIENREKKIFNSPAPISLFSFQIFSETEKFLIIKNWQKSLTKTDSFNINKIL